uniref:Integrase catalytic domain-containing protein n=1 Tax=Anopheles dirus TaxID=7168 RepID=A0A182NT30_9DIPT
MHLAEDKWPESSVSSSCEAAASEQRISTVNCAAIERSHQYIFTLYSSFSKLRRIVAYWVQYFKRRYKQQEYTGTGLTTQDLKEAEIVLCRLAQQDHFSQETKALKQNKPLPASSKLKWLHPQLGADGVIRVGGRLSKSLLPEDTKHPLVVPNGHPLAFLLMDHFHKVCLHAGPQRMLSTSRQRYWIIGGRNIARRIYYQCLTCFRARPSSSETLMADLPSTRVTPGRPFSITGIDYCGPVFVKGAHRRAVATKAYVAIFVCFITRAVHIELVSNLTTEAFLSALRRFIARRGLPKELHSDNATNFKGPTMEKAKYNIPLFNGESNFENWGFRVQTVLDAEGVWNVVTNEDSRNIGSLYRAKP